MNVICLDGSLQNFAYSVVKVDIVNFDIKNIVKIATSKTKPSKVKGIRKSADDLARFRQHWLFVNAAIKEYDCEIAIAEVPSGAKDARASFSFGGVTAIYACLPLPLVQVTALAAKAAATGNKYADKEDVIEWAVDRFPEAAWTMTKRSNNMGIIRNGLYVAPTNEHVADACAIGLAGIKDPQFKNILNQV